MAAAGCFVTVPKVRDAMRCDANLIYENEQRITACLVSPSLCPRRASPLMPFGSLQSSGWRPHHVRQGACARYMGAAGPLRRKSRAGTVRASVVCWYLRADLLGTRKEHGRQLLLAKTQTIRKRRRTVQGSIGIHSGGAPRQLMPIHDHDSPYLPFLRSIANASCGFPSQPPPACQPLCQSASLLSPSSTRR